MPLPAPLVTPTYTRGSPQALLLTSRISARKIAVSVFKSPLLALIMQHCNTDDEATPTPLYQVNFDGPQTSEAAAWYHPGDSLPVGGTPTFEYAGHTQKYYAIGSVKNRMESLLMKGLNSQHPGYDPAASPDEVIRSIGVKTADAELMLLGDAVWNGPLTGRSMNGITAFMERAAPASQTVVFMGIDKATQPKWRNQYVSFVGNFSHITAGRGMVDGLWFLDQLINSCCYMSHRPSHCVTTQAVYNNIVRALSQIGLGTRHISESKIKVDFESFEYRGVKFCYDHRCPSGTIWMLHLNPNISNILNPDGSLIPDDRARGPGAFEFNPQPELFLISHPHIRGFQVVQDFNNRTLTSGAWRLGSMQLGCTNLQAFGVGDGSGWETW